MTTAIVTHYAPMCIEHKLMFDLAKSVNSKWAQSLGWDFVTDDSRRVESKYRERAAFLVEVIAGLQDGDRVLWLDGDALIVANPESIWTDLDSNDIGLVKFAYAHWNVGVAPMIVNPAIRNLWVEVRDHTHEQDKKAIVVGQTITLLTFASELYADLLANWSRSILSDCRPVVHTFSAEPVTFAQGEWHRIMAKKLDLIMKQIDTSAPDEIFVFSDLDVQFFGPIAADVRTLMQEYDILFQYDLGTQYTATLKLLSAGFMAIRACAASRKVFEQAQAYLLEHDDPRIDGQESLRAVVVDEHIARLGLLPTRYWTHGRPGWTLGQELDPPADILTHHANWLIGNDVKMAQLVAVREIVDKRNNHEVWDANVCADCQIKPGDRGPICGSHKIKLVELGRRWNEHHDKIDNETRIVGHHIMFDEAAKLKAMQETAQWQSQKDELGLK